MEAGKAGGSLNSLGNLVCIFGNARYLAAGAASAIAFFIVLVFASNILVWGFWELNPFADPVRIALDLIIAALFGANIGLLLHNFDMRKEAAGGSQMTAFGAFAAMMTSSCPLCQPSILLAFGLGGIGALFAGLGLVIALFSIGLLVVSLRNGLQAAKGTCGMGIKVI